MQKIVSSRAMLRQLGNGLHRSHSLIHNTMHNHDHFKDLAALAALDALEPDERLVFEQHVATCAECRQEFRAHRAVAVALDQSVPQVQAPAHLEARVLRRIKATPQSRLQARRSKSSRWIAAVALLVCLLLGGVALRSWQQTNDLRVQNTAQATAIADLRLALPGVDARLIHVAARDGSAIQGQMAWTPAQPHATIVVQNLPPPADNRCYVLWLIRRDGTTDNVGAFYDLDQGTLRASVQAQVPWSEYAQVALTNEPAAAHSAAQPSGEPFVAGSFGDN